MLWTSRRGHTHDLDIPQHARNELLTQIEDDHRWALVRSLLRTPGRARPPAPQPHARPRRRRPHPRPAKGLPRRGPGHPLSTGQLKVRLARLGIHGRFGRNTALMDLAAKLPPVALARLLGIHIDTAGAWAERAGGSPAAYAAQVFRR